MSTTGPVKPTVLFLCTGNSARSQMAEALLKRYAGGLLDVQSAGLQPQGVHPLAVRAMAEVGIDISDQRSKGLREFLGKRLLRALIVLCQQAEQHCPTTWPGVVQVREFWPFDDPAAGEGTEEERLDRFRAVREELDARIRRWVSEVVSVPSAAP